MKKEQEKASFSPPEAAGAHWHAIDSEGQESQAPGNHREF